MKLLRINDVIQKVGVKKTTIYNLIKKGEFPKPIKIGSISLWLDKDINDAIQNYANYK